MPGHELENNVLSYRRPAPADRDLLRRKVVAQAKALRSEFLQELWREIYAWYQRRLALTQLRALDDAALKDIGLHRSGIEAAVDHGSARTLPQKQRPSPAKPNLRLQGTPAAYRCG